MAEEGWGMVMPFVVCKSAGGPFDDESFVAGFACGGIYTGLAWNIQATKVVETPIKRAILPQVDLIAMHYGYTLIVEGDDPDWCQVTFVKVEDGL